MDNKLAGNLAKIQGGLSFLPVLAENMGNQDQMVAPLGKGEQDLQAISQQQYTKDPFNPMSVAQGAAAGAQIGGPIGAGIGGGMGLLSEVVSLFNQKKAERKFEKEKAKRLRAASAINLGISTRERKRSMLGNAGKSQYERFYG